MRSENRVVGLDHRSSHRWGGIDAKFQLALLAIVDREALHQQGAKARARAAAEGVEHKETLETSAVIGNMAHLVENRVDQLLAHGVVAASVVVRRILLSGDHLLGMEEVPVGAGADFVDNIGLEIAVDGARHVLALP